MIEKVDGRKEYCVASCLKVQVCSILYRGPGNCPPPHPPGDFGLLAGQNSSFEADGRRQYINAAELLVRQNQKEETTEVFSFLAHMELNEYLLN